MTEKYTAIQAETAHALLEQVGLMRPEHRGIDRRAYLFDDYAVLSTSRLKVRNVDVRDDDLHYLDDIIDRLACLNKAGIHTVPVLGYCYDPDTPDGEGYLIMRRARGAELYDDAIICRYEAWTQGRDDVYLNGSADAAEYIVSRTHTVAGIPQEHFDKFVSDIRAILESDILIDFQGKSNFFYDEDAGFQFIDLDSHTDSYYGLTEETVSVEAWTAVGGFAPCHFGEGTELFAPLALDSQAVREIGEERLRLLAGDNLRIFEKCLRAMKTNGISDSVLNRVVPRIRVFGQKP